MNRRTFLVSSSTAGVGTLLPAPAVGNNAETDSAERFSWNTGKLQFEFSVLEVRLGQDRILPIEGELFKYEQRHICAPVLIERFDGTKPPHAAPALPRKSGDRSANVRRYCTSIAETIASPLVGLNSRTNIPSLPLTSKRD
jgi:hypothetical protein